MSNTYAQTLASIQNLQHMERNLINNYNDNTPELREQSLEKMRE